MDKKDIDRINELARKSKSVGLTGEETAERDRLRRQYIDEFKQNLKATLDSVRVQQEDGSYRPLEQKKGPRMN